MSRRSIILSILILLLSLSFVSIVHVNAQVSPDQILAEILPPESAANATILLRFTTINSSIGDVENADIFWDNNSIAFNEAGAVGAVAHSYNYNLTVPTEPPMSDVGNHTIRVESSVFNYGHAIFIFTFNVTEFVPSPEYLELNETYNQLKTNYTDIRGNFTELQASFTELSANYTTLLQEHNNDTLNYNTLIAQYNVLNSDYNSLTANFNFISTNYADLNDTYDALSSNYASLQASFQALAANYVALNTSYTSLISNYNSLTGQLNQSRNINIVLVITTIALIIITIYFAILRPRATKKQR